METKRILALAALFSWALPAAELITIDATADVHPISPEIYGVNCPFGADPAAIAGLNAPLVRWGGNSLSRYHWRNDADNKGADWFFESIAAPPGETGNSCGTWLAHVGSAGARALITIPTLDWLARLGPQRGKLASFAVAQYGAQQHTDQWLPDAGNGLRADGSAITGNDPRDANEPNSPELQAAWVAHLAAQRRSDGTRAVAYYLLDNEPALWHQTHRDIHPAPPHDAEVLAKMLAYATAIKDADPQAVIGGPEEYGWDGYFWSGFDLHWRGAHGLALNAPDHVAHGDHVPWLLAQLRAAGTAHGRRLLDVFTLHWYPQPARGSDGKQHEIDANGGDADSPQAQLVRNRSTRALWDPAYVDESWIAGSPNDASGGIVQLIPRMRAWVAQHYPGTRIGLTEYRWGDADRLNGATTQADVLGILGREGCDLATRWIIPDPIKEAPTYHAMRMYRNYDGKRSTFGDTSVRATVADPDLVSAFAALRSSDRALTVMLINKTAEPRDIALRVAHFAAGAGVSAWQTSGSDAAIGTAAAPSAIDGAYAMRLPPQTITLLIVPAQR